jgi:SAM-dependent methyltransferase
MRIVDVARNVEEVFMHEGDKLNSLDTSGIVIPPSDIRYRIVNKDNSEEDYLHVGRCGIEGIVEHLRPYTHLEKRAARVLDFGCGCARWIQPLKQMFPQWDVVGTDIDPVAIAWNRENVRDVAFDVNKSNPPLLYESQSFDLVYALSVFSHLNAEMEDAWLAELMRLLKVEGFLYLSFIGERILQKIPEGFPEEIVEAYRSKGFAYFSNIGDGILPDWYQTSLQSGEYVARRLTELVSGASVLEHRIGGLMDWQDSMVIQRVR